MSFTLPNPPKFSGDNSPGPTSVRDYTAFWRWLISVFQTLEAATQAQQIPTFIPPRPINPADITLALTQAILAGLVASQVNKDPSAAPFARIVDGLTAAVSLALTERDPESASFARVPDTMTDAVQFAISRNPGPPDAEYGRIPDELTGAVALSLSRQIPPPRLQLPSGGPGPGTFTVGLKLTGGGTNGTITIDAEGRITAITQAT